MKKTIALALIAGSLSLSVSPSFASEIKGPDLMSMLNGKALTCRAGGKDLTLKFGQTSAKSTSVAFKYALGSNSGTGTYVMMKNGRLKQKETGATRKFAFNKKKQLTITGSGVQPTTCNWP